MEVGSFIGAAAITGGEVRIRNASPGDLRMVRLVYERLGVIWEEEGEDVFVPARQPLCIDSALGGRILEIKPLPWPGFPPDLMSIAVVIASQSDGSVLLHDWMYESRFFFVDKLRFMGARVVLCDPHRVIVQGKSKLQANPYGVTSPDIRAGMAMVLAGALRRRDHGHSQHPADRPRLRADRDQASVAGRGSSAGAEPATMVISRG
jgi:UDP-N-acetylglucosamine 1-carboxyvinyltransferase